MAGAHDRAQAAARNAKFGCIYYRHQFWLMLIGMALSNYLMHSAVLTSLFYGYGLGLYGEIPRLAQILFVVGVIGLQLVISPVWLQRYRFGPVENGYGAPSPTGSVNQCAGSRMTAHSRY